MTQESDLMPSMQIEIQTLRIYSGLWELSRFGIQTHRYVGDSWYFGLSNDIFGVWWTSNLQKLSTKINERPDLWDEGNRVPTMTVITFFVKLFGEIKSEGSNWKWKQFSLAILRAKLLRSYENGLWPHACCEFSAFQRKRSKPNNSGDIT